MEVIESIKECSFKRVGGYNHFDGYEIKTNKQTVKLGIESGQSCCENYGYFMSEDALDEYIGAELLKVEVVDTCRNKDKFEKVNLYQGGVMFVDLVTNKGTLQFTAYNEHNGYYGHDAVVISEQLNSSACL